MESKQPQPAESAHDLHLAWCFASFLAIVASLCSVTVLPRVFTVMLVIVSAVALAAAMMTADGYRGGGSPGGDDPAGGEDPDPGGNGQQPLPESFDWSSFERQRRHHGEQQPDPAGHS